MAGSAVDAVLRAAPLAEAGEVATMSVLGAVRSQVWAARTSVISCSE
jgi:hypothetical protein